ncbi:MAG TPA: hypothetical protein VLM41_00480, partial [Steroidobacteraceae bacterium]|nr:hypothetical protein [Steroidobacteraceae bacterium]
MHRTVEPVPLPQLGVVRFAGPQAADFLQGQLTNDVRQLADGRTQLAACNTPQGRVIALLRLRQQDSVIDALVPSELADRLATHLRRYVLRAKVAIEIPTGMLCALLPPGSAELPDAVRFSYSPTRTVAATSVEAWKAAGLPEPPQQDAGKADAWIAADIAEGLPQIFAASSESYTAQMLNLDLLDAISFSKGCYTGQEIVARTQHLGRIKRRTLRYRLDGMPVPAIGDALLRDGAKLGEVLMAAPVSGGVEMLAVVSLEALGHELDTADGRRAVPLD